ncbi:MAG TPA: DUF948 domain-containing protein [Sporosarcina sp.]|nr:DUF948 domain-containing protein [Sporosarcina sp.]
MTIVGVGLTIIGVALLVLSFILIKPLNKLALVLDDVKKTTSTLPEKVDDSANEANAMLKNVNVTLETVNEQLSTVNPILKMVEDVGLKGQSFTAKWVAKSTQFQTKAIHEELKNAEEKMKQ